MAETQTLQIAVVGHTNTGKTSLMRTLIRDGDFGHVADAPGTTRQVQAARILLKGECVLTLYDTPGIEDSIGLQDYLEQIATVGQRLDGPERIRLFLQGPEACGRYEQEGRVLRKLLDCQAGLYVIDVRDAVLAKHRDELSILVSCGRPLLPVLNFVVSPSARTAEWREALARVGLHTCVEFDSVSPPIDGEDTLYKTLSILLSPYQAILLQLQSQAASQRAARHATGLELIAGLLIDVASLRTLSPAGRDQPDLEQQSVLGQQSLVRQREQAAVQALLALFQFRPDDYLHHPLPVTDGRWKVDLFNPQAMKNMGIHIGKGFAAGAVAGAAVDVLSAGLSLGTGMLIGALAGGAVQGLGRWGARILGHLRGARELTVRDEILQLLALRQTLLLAALVRRGHAAINPVRIANQSPSPYADQLPAVEFWNRSGPEPEADSVPLLPEPLQRALAHPEWSLMGNCFQDCQARQRTIAELSLSEFLQILPSNSPG